MKIMFIFLSMMLLLMLLAVFLTGCGSDDDGGRADCCPYSVYTTNDAVAQELLGWPSGWEEVCEQTRAGNDIFGGRRYVRGLCFAPDYDYTYISRSRAGGADRYGPTCAQCVQDGQEFGGRRIWVPCDEKTVRCRPDVRGPVEEQERRPPLPSYCYPWGEAVERCGFLERFLETVLKVTRHATGSRMGTHHRGKARKAASICGPAATRIRYDRLTT